MGMSAVCLTLLGLYGLYCVGKQAVEYGKKFTDSVKSRI